MARIQLTLLSLLLCLSIKAQQDSLRKEHFREVFWCDSLLLSQPQLIQVGSQSVKYFLVNAYQVGGSSGTMDGTIIVPNINVTDDVNFIINIANAIATKESLDEIVLFKTCAGERSYMSSVRTKYTKESIRENYLGRFIMNK